MKLPVSKTTPLENEGGSTSVVEIETDCACGREVLDDNIFGPGAVQLTHLQTDGTSARGSVPVDGEALETDIRAI